MYQMLLGVLEYIMIIPQSTFNLFLKKYSNFLKKSSNTSIEKNSKWKRNCVIESVESHTAPPDTSQIKSVRVVRNHSWETEKTWMCQKKGKKNRRK